MEHLQSVCLMKNKEDRGYVKIISKRAMRRVKITNSTETVCMVNRQQFTFEVDTGSGDNFCSKDIGNKRGEPALTKVSSRCQVANGQLRPVLGTFRVSASLLMVQKPVTLAFTITDIPKLMVAHKL